MVLGGFRSFHVLVTTYINNLWEGCTSRVRVCLLVLHIIFRTRKYKNRPLKIHTRFQTWPLFRNYFIITYISAPSQKQTNSARCISCSILFTWNWNDKYVNFIPVHRLRTYLENHTPRTIPDSRPKRAKCIPVFRPKRPKNPTRCGGVNRYGLCKGKPSGIQ